MQVNKCMNQIIALSYTRHEGQI